jgi:hypothetical protein
VEDAAEPVSSAYIQVGDSLWIRDRIGVTPFIRGMRIPVSTVRMPAPA